MSKLMEKIRGNNMSSIIRIYDIDPQTLSKAKALAEDLKKLNIRYQDITILLKKSIEKKSQLQRELASLEREYQKGNIKSPRQLDLKSVDVDAIDEDIRTARRDLIMIADEIKNTDSELRIIGDSIKQKFTDAMNDAILKRDDYFKKAVAYDAELLRINRMLTETGIFRPLHVFKKDLPRGLQISMPLPHEYENWLRDPYHEVQNIDL